MSFLAANAAVAQIASLSRKHNIIETRTRNSGAIARRSKGLDLCGLNICLVKIGSRQGVKMIGASEHTQPAGFG
jgi:hypothetical protein